jgi:hypothetical protein
LATVANRDPCASTAFHPCVVQGAAAVRRCPAQGFGSAEHAGSHLDEALAALSPDDLTPKAALEALYRLKELSRRSQ